MKKFIAIIIAICLFFFLSGCTAPQPAESNFDFVFKYGYGAEPKNELNTFNGTFTKDMVLEPSITVKLSLSKEEMDKIHQKMEEIDFLGYPDRFKVIVPAGNITSIVTPYPSYYFKVKYDSKIKELWWADEIRNADTQASKLRMLIVLIHNIVESKEEFKKLPASRGGYM